ncbi:MAG: outer membrane beta-barrel protein, partial [bacterium]|nr:outer membrane beta-barrel protein [bacterium]
MRSIGRTIAITAAGLLLFSQFAQASEVEAELRQMQERIAQLEGQLGNETDSLLEEESGSYLSSLIENTDLGGFVAASYNYNFEGHHNGSQATANPNASHVATNSFTIDQAWISIDNQATEDSRAGVHVDYEFGVVNGAGVGALYSAWASYLAPIGNGILVEGGLVPTLIGAEVNETNANFNVTRGLVWQLQPTTHVGAIVGREIVDGISVKLGFLNDPLAPKVIADTNNEKAVTGQVAWAGENMTASGQIVWGSSPAPEIDTTIWDVVVTCDAMEDVSVWVNYTGLSFDDGPLDGEVHGIAAAARWAVSDDLGIAVRGEVVIEDNDTAETEFGSLTVTGDYALTDHLTAKGEVRFDFADEALPDRHGALDEDVASMILAQ